MKRVRFILFAACAAAAAAPLLLSCNESPLSVLNADFLSDLGVGGDRAAFLPGEAPAVLIIVENGTGRQVEAQLSYRLGSDTVQSAVRTLAPQVEIAEAYLCPITEVTLGDISDLEQSGAIVRLGAGGTNDPFLNIEPFGALLQEGVNYDCGDVIRFSIRPSGVTPSGYQIFAFIQRAPS